MAVDGVSPETKHAGEANKDGFERHTKNPSG